MARAAINPVTKVTAQQERFAFEFVKTGRPSVAYRRAYDAEKMNQDSIRVEAGRLLDNPAIALRVEHYRKIAEARMEITIERIALETARIALFDMRELVDDEGNSIALQDLPEDTARALNGMDIEELFAGAGSERKLIGHVKKYKHVPKIEALRLLAQWKKMLIERSEVGKPGEFDALTDADIEEQAKAAVADAVKGGYLKLVKTGKNKLAA